MPLKYHHGYNTGNTIRKFPRRLHHQECHEENYVPVEKLKYDRERAIVSGRHICLRCGFRCWDPICPPGKKSLKKLKSLKRDTNYDLHDAVNIENIPDDLGYLKGC